MKALIQRVKYGSVSVNGNKIASIKTGYVVLLGARTGDSPKDAEYLARRTVNLRIFPDENDKMNKSINDVGGSILVISQFTLYADTKKGNRPSFIKAGNPDTAKELYEKYVENLKTLLSPERVKTGQFAADMLVKIANDGPVTIELHTDYE